MLEILGPAFLEKGVPFGLDGVKRFRKLALEISALLMVKNGFFCFEQPLRVFPSATTAMSYGIHEWNQRETWKHEYRALGDSIFCFAEDIFGNRFCIADNAIGFFDAEPA